MIGGDTAVLLDELKKDVGPLSKGRLRHDQGKGQEREEGGNEDSLPLPLSPGVLGHWVPDSRYGPYRRNFVATYEDCGYLFIHSCSRGPPRRRREMRDRRTPRTQTW